MTSTPTVERICPQCGARTPLELCPQHGIPTLSRVGSTGETVQTGEIIGGRYRVEKLLGRGGFGAVYVVTHITLQQQLVLKVLKSSLTDDETQVKRFHQEARIACKLTHPHTVRVHDFGQTDSGNLYLAMELLHGKELGTVLTEEGILTPERSIRIALGVLKSLGEAHQAGLVHRDLKPDNIFLCHVHGEDDFVKVIDFGIAKPVDQSDDDALTRTGFTVGTPKYMSPEQVLNKGVDGRSDLYALGVMLYQCVSGELPIVAGSSVETMMAHVQQAPRPLGLSCPQELPDGLEALIMRSLRKDPAERFADAEDMRAALEDVVERNGLVLLKRARSAKMRAVSPDGQDQDSQPVLHVPGRSLTPSHELDATRVHVTSPSVPVPSPSAPMAAPAVDLFEATVRVTPAQARATSDAGLARPRTLVEPTPIATPAKDVRAHLDATMDLQSPAPAQARGKSAPALEMGSSRPGKTTTVTPVVAAKPAVPGWAIVVGLALLGAGVAWLMTRAGAEPAGSQPSESATAAPAPTVAAPASPSAPMPAPDPAPQQPTAAEPAPVDAPPRALEPAPVAPASVAVPAAKPEATVAPAAKPEATVAPAKPVAKPKVKRVDKPVVNGDEAI